MKNKTMIKYCFVQGLFWMLFCSCYGYITYYLVGKGFSAGEVGIITAVFGLIGALVQPVLGRFVDDGKIGWKKLSVILYCGMLLSALIICFVNVKLVQGIFFGLTLVFLNGSMPLINRAGFVCQSENDKINFGVARGIGSLSYAVLSLILGKITVLFGPVSVPVSTGIVGLSIIFSILLMPKGDSPTLADELSGTMTDSSNDKSAKNSALSVLKAYPEFFIMWISCILQMTFHNLSNTYLIQICERAGGSSGTLGIALAIAAITELPFMFCFTLINKKISAKRLLLISSIAFVVKAVGYIFSFNIPVLYGTQLVQCASFAIYASASVYYAEEAVKSEDKTTAQSFMSNSQTIGSVIGSLVGGFLISGTNLNVTLIVAAVIAGLGVLCALIPVVVHADRKK